MAIRNLHRGATRAGAHKGSAYAAPIYVDSDDSKIKFVPGGEGSSTEVEVVDASTTQTLTNKTLGTTMTAGAGVSAAETYKTSVTKEGNLIVTKFVVDLTGLVGSASDLDIIGNTGGATSANFGQITAAVNGTIAAGRVTCLEVPAGGADDIDFYTATVGTGAQDGLVTDLTETVLITSGAAWASGTVKGMTTVPPADGFLYIVNGEAVGGTFTAGKFLIELFGA